MRERPSLGSLPTVRPSDIHWLDAARPLLVVPAGTVVVDASTALPSPSSLETWVGFFSAATAFDASWGATHGAVRVTTIEVERHRVEIISAFGRLAFLVADKSFGAPLQPKELAARVARAVDAGERYSLEWAAAAYALHVLEGK